MLQAGSTSPQAVMLQNGLVSGLAWAFGLGLGGSVPWGVPAAAAF